MGCLSRVAVQCSSSGQHVADVVWRPLGVQAQQCFQDLNRMREKTACLTSAGSQSSAKRTWRRVRTVLEAKDFERMWDRIQYHVSMLGVLLEVVNRFVKVPFSMLSS